MLAGGDLIEARDASESALDTAQVAIDLAVDGDYSGSHTELTAAITDLDRARSALDTTVVRIAGRMPVVGADIRAGRSAVEAARSLALAGSDLLGFLEADRPDIFSDQRFNPIALEMLADALGSAGTHAASARTSLGAAPEPRIGSIKEKLTELDDASQQLHDGLEGATALVARLQTTAAETLRTLILFENAAELRGTGGFMGFFTVLAVDDGELILDRVGPISDLRSVDVSGKLTAVTAPADYTARYGGYLANTALWSNVNLSPHFPWVGQVAGDLYAAATGEHADLVVRIDLTGLGDIVATFSPDLLALVPFDPLLLATDVVLDSYLRFPDNVDQNTYLATLIGSVFASVIATEDAGADGLPGAVVEAIRQRRLAVFSDDVDVERLFVAAAADGSLQPGERGQVDVVTQNFGANKLDLFTSTTIEVDLEPAGCSLMGTISTTITNAAPADALLLPAGDLGLVGRWWVNTYVPRTATVLQILVDGEAVTGSVQSELDRPVAAKIVEIPPNESVTVTVRWQETLAGDTYQLRMHPQPLIHPATLSVSGFEDQLFTQTAQFDIPTSCND